MAAKISTAALAKRDLVDAWRETIGRGTMSFELDLLPGVPFEAIIRRHALPGIGICDLTHSGMIYRRGPTQINNDDLILTIVCSGEHTVSHLGNETAVRPGQVCLTTNAEQCIATMPFSERVVVLRFPHSLVSPALAKPETVLGRSIVPNPQVLRLLLNYKELAMTLPVDAPAEITQCAARHLLDLAVLALGATGDFAQEAQLRGVRAARLHAIKVDIRNHIGTRTLSVSTISDRHRVSPRYVRLLFEQEGTTFSEFVLAERLDRALRLLTGNDALDLKISAIAYSVGFSDLSHFNRAFRRRFGMTPSDARSIELRTK